jgi:hypothetical protein
VLAGAARTVRVLPYAAIQDPGIFITWRAVVRFCDTAVIIRIVFIADGAARISVTHASIRIRIIVMIRRAAYIWRRGRESYASVELRIIVGARRANIIAGSILHAIAKRWVIVITGWARIIIVALFADRKAELLIVFVGKAISNFQGEFCEAGFSDFGANRKILRFVVGHYSQAIGQGFVDHFTGDGGILVVRAYIDSFLVELVSGGFGEDGVFGKAGILEFIVVGGVDTNFFGVQFVACRV